LHKDEIISYVEKKRLERRLRTGRLRSRGANPSEYDLRALTSAQNASEDDEQEEQFPAAATSYYTSGRTSSAAQHFDNADLRRMRIRALDTTHDHDSLYSDNISLHTRQSSYSLDSEPSLYYDVLPRTDGSNEGFSTPFTPSESELTSDLSTVEATDEEDDAFVVSDTTSMDLSPFVVVRRRQAQ
jgi:hypothetical protein